MRGCYLLHFSEPYPGGTAPQHYLGWAEDVERRVEEHRKGQGAKLCLHVAAQGIQLDVVRVWEGGDRKLERELKRAHRPALYCPHCRAELLQRKREQTRAWRRRRSQRLLLLCPETEQRRAA